MFTTGLGLAIAAMWAAAPGQSALGVHLYVNSAAVATGGSALPLGRPFYADRITLGAVLVIFIVVKFTIRAERSNEWLTLVEDFTKGTRSEPGNLWFEWSRSVDDPHQYILLEAFESAEAGKKHVSSEHFTTAMAWMPQVIATTPEIINMEVPADGWSHMAELTPA